MIGAAELAALQSAWTLLCDQTMTLNRNLGRGAPAADGTMATVWTAIYINLPCVVDEPTGAVAEIAAELADMSSWMIAAPNTFQGQAVTVINGDQVVIAALGLTLIVQHILQPQSYTLNTNFLASKPR